MKVKLISESNFTIKEHGVHTAFLQTKRMLEDQNVEVVVNSLEKADITHIHTVGPYSLSFLLRDKKVVVSAHVIPESFIGSLILTRYWLPGAESYLRYFYNKANLVLAVSEKAKEALEKLGVKQKIEVMPNPIDTELFKPDKSAREKALKELGFTKDDFIAISVGQVQPRKGFETYIKTAKALPNYKFLWVGSRPFKKLTAGASESDKLLKNPPKNFFHIEAAGYEAMPKYYNAANIFFFPSHQETFGMVIIEAAACGLPLLMRDLPVYKPLFGDNYLVGEENSFVDIIKQLAKEPDFYKKYSEKSKELTQKFSFEVLGPKLIRYYQKVLKS